MTATINANYSHAPRVGAWCCFFMKMPFVFVKTVADTYITCYEYLKYSHQPPKLHQTSHK